MAVYEPVRHQKNIIWNIRVITKLPYSEQSYKGKVKTHKYINRQNQTEDSEVHILFW
jgi:hypothetical protein